MMAGESSAASKALQSADPALQSADPALQAADPSPQTADPALQNTADPDQMLSVTEKEGLLYVAGYLCFKLGMSEKNLNVMKQN